MKKSIEDILALQEKDMRIRGLKMRLAMIPTEKAKLNATLEQEKNSLKAQRESLSKTEMEMKQKESAINQVNEEIKKLQNQTVLIKKNDEYQAMLKEIESRKGKISDIETEIIMLIDKKEALAAEFKAYEKTFGDREKSIQAELKELTQLEGDLKNEIISQTNSRAPLEAVVPKDNLGLYTRILNTGKGEPLGKVLQGITCSNCHLKLTPQTLTLTKRGDLAICDNCSRMLYMPDEEMK